MPAELDPLARRRCRPTGGVATTSSFMVLVSFDRTVLVLVLVLVLKPRPVYAWLRCRSLPNWASDGYRMRAKIRCACVIMGGPPGRRTPMNENELFQAALGLLPPWLVSRCTFEASAGRLDIHLDFPRGSVFPCPVCGVPCKAYDTDDLTWRHLNFFQHQAFLHARTPRVECSRCGIHRVAVPWARADSNFTLLFEALVVMLAKSMPVLAVARLVNEHDTLIWRIVTHYVDAARAKADHSTVTQVGVDDRLPAWPEIRFPFRRSGAAQGVVRHPGQGRLHRRCFRRRPPGPRRRSHGRHRRQRRHVASLRQGDRCKPAQRPGHLRQIPCRQPGQQRRRESPPPGTQRPSRTRRQPLRLAQEPREPHPQPVGKVRQLRHRQLPSKTPPRLPDPPRLPGPLHPTRRQGRILPRQVVLLGHPQPHPGYHRRRYNHPSPSGWRPALVRLRHQQRNPRRH